MRIHLRAWAGCCALVAGLWISGPLMADEPPQSQVPEAAFQALDQDGNQSLSLDEFLKREGDQKVLTRDFRMFDLNADGKLSLSEFVAVPGILPDGRRGPLADPCDVLLEQAVSAMDEFQENWDLDPKREVDEREFLQAYFSSLAQVARLRFSAGAAKHFDRDGNGKLNREEARQFLARQLGIIWDLNTPIRRPDGRVAPIRQFLMLDVESDRELLRPEFLRWQPEKGNELFLAADKDRSGGVTFAEFCAAGCAPDDDPIEDFRRADRNLDAYLDKDELQHLVPQEYWPLIPVTLRAWDSDNNGMLSLQEFRLSMFGNPAAFRGKLPSDNNRDGKLSVDEFLTSDVLFPLLTRLTFHKCDADGDGFLSREEFPIQSSVTSEFYVLAWGENEARRVLVDRSGQSCNSPAFSPDAKQFAFDTAPETGSSRSSKVYITDLRGRSRREVSDGRFPSWSPDGKQLVIARYDENQGIWIMDADGSNKQRIADGWSASWSPDGRSIAFVRSNSIWVYDLESKMSREVLPRDGHPYQSLDWNLCWHPESRRLFAVGKKPKSADIISLDTAGETADMRIHWSPTQSFDPNIACSPDGQKLYLSLFTPEVGRNTLHVMDLAQKQSPQRVTGLDARLTSRGVSCSRDGKWILVGARVPP